MRAKFQSHLSKQSRMISDSGQRLHPEEDLSKDKLEKNCVDFSDSCVRKIQFECPPQRFFAEGLVALIVRCASQSLRCCEL